MKDNIPEVGDEVMFNPPFVKAMKKLIVAGQSFAYGLIPDREHEVFRVVKTKAAGIGEIQVALRAPDDIIYDIYIGPTGVSTGLDVDKYDPLFILALGQQATSSSSGPFCNCEQPTPKSIFVGIAHSGECITICNKCKNEIST
jgi:hypothetical protein